MGTVVNAADHMGLVHVIARKYLHRGVELEDLVQEGALGVMRAANKFEPARGLKFSTYATYWIHCFIQRYFAEKGLQIRLPVYKHKALKRQGQLPPVPTSLDRALRHEKDTDERFTLHDVLADPNAENPETEAERRDQYAHLDAALSTLKPRLRYVIQRRFVDERTLEEIGMELGVVRELVRQLEKKAVLKLRKYFDEFVH